MSGSQLGTCLGHAVAKLSAVTSKNLKLSPCFPQHLRHFKIRNNINSFREAIFKGKSYQVYFQFSCELICEWVDEAKQCSNFGAKEIPNIAKGTTDPRVECLGSAFTKVTCFGRIAISYTNLNQISVSEPQPNISISKYWSNFNFKISMSIKTMVKIQATYWILLTSYSYIFIFPNVNNMFTHII